MGLTLSYNGYTHVAGAVLSVARQSLLTRAETVYAEAITIDLDGTLIGTSVADIDEQLLALVDAYSRDGGDFLVINTVDGVSTQLATCLFSKKTLGGIRVMRRPNLPDGRNASGVTFLNYRVTLQATVRATDAYTELRSFQETIQFSGGGPRRGHVETRVGLPQPQIWTQNQIYRAVQFGQAVGLYERPVAPLSIWPTSLVTNPNVTHIGGRLVGGGVGRGWMDFGIRWRYRFESSLPFLGEPADWGEI